MTRPHPYLIRMALFLVAVAAVGAMIAATLHEAFRANPSLNGLILGVLFLGILYIFRQVQLLYREVAWIESFRAARPGAPVPAPPRLLAPMAAMLGERRQQDQLRLSALSTRSMLDSIGSRLDEARDISRYLIGLLIFLGLLGTFWGLIETIGAVSGTLDGLNVGEGQDVVSLFDTLKDGLAAPLSGMGTAFSSSLFGLAGSLVLGFLDLQSSQAQNRFYNELEEWLSSVTRLHSGGGLSIEGEQSVPAYVSALLEQTADSLDRLQRTLARNEEMRRGADQQMAALTDRLATLTDQMHAEQQLLLKLVEGQSDLKPLIERLAATQGTGGMDEASRAHLRNLDVVMTRLLEETVAGRGQLADELRSEIKLLARTIAATREPGRGT
ncbi:MAG: flagellar motor protein MotA [Rhodospirillales bacterium]|nr:flagellar motor protein MotA [Rhodospirillales bacterium]